jgi:predicted alpha-1,2-mannosidase
MINSMLAHYDQSVHHILPVWSHYANENWCMIGYHATPVIADAYMKGIRGFDAQKALEACYRSATYAPYDGIGYYMKYGFVPCELNTNSASKTLEYAYDDYAIARFAEAMGNDTMAQSFRKRSGNFANVWDPSVRFMRPRMSNGVWRTSFDPLSTEGQGFIEGNAWNYSLYVPQDIPKLISFYGGNKAFAAHLDSLFSVKLPEKYFAQSEDLSAAGMIGNYVHGNEPSHHVPYLYVFAGYPSRTQEKVHEIVTTMYSDTPEGVCGNDDCGQMSAWYVFSALGFYPVCPGSGEYVIGTPAVRKAVLHLENGKTFVVSAPAQDERNYYVKKVFLNGQRLGTYILRHEDLMKGGELLFELSDRP